MGHANTNCLISSLSIGDKKVLCTILAPTTRKDNFFDIRNAENKLYYPITMPFVGVYSPDELGLESYEENAWITNLVNHFRTGVRKAKQDKFDALALLSCINDKRNDECHDLFLRFNENLLISLLKGKNKKGKERDSYVEPMVDWVCVSYWLFNLARPWIPSVWSHQDDSGNKKVIKLAKMILKLNKNN